MKSEDTVEDPLMSFQFYINSKSVFISCYSPSIVFIFIAKDVWICISTMLWIFETKQWQNFLMTSEDTVEDPLMIVQFYIKSKIFFISFYSPSTVFSFIAKDAWICIFTTLWIFKTKPRHKLFDDIWRHVWRSVDERSILYKPQKFFHFVIHSIYCFPFYCKRRLNLYFYHAMNLWN